MEFDYLIGATIEINLDKTVFNKDGFIIARVYSPSALVKDLLNPIYKNISIKGKMATLRDGIDYEATIEKAEKNQYGVTLSVTSVHPKNISMDNMNTDEDMVTFIEVFIGGGTADKVGKVKGLCDMVKNGDVNSLTKIKGIGEKTANKIIQTYKDEVVGSEFIIKFKKLGFTDNEINKLRNEFDDDLLLAHEQVTTNIFSLVFKGFQLGRMDKIFLENLKGSKKDRMRIKTYLWKGLKDAMYYRYKSYISLEDFYAIDIVQNIEANVGRELVDECIESLAVNKKVKIIDNMYITTREEYDIEKKLMNLLDEITTTITPKKLDIVDLDKDIEEQEDIMGFKLNEGQRRAVKDIILSTKPLCMLNGFAGCVDCDTEYFNGKEWVRIADYKKGDKVLSYYAEGYAKLVDPIRYVKTPQDKLNFFTNNRGSINQCLSDGHNFVYETSKGHLTSKPFDQVKEMHNKSKYGFSGKILTSFNYGGEGIKLTDEEIRVMVMVMADGTFPKHIESTNRCYVNIKKERKKERARKILSEANIEYNETLKENGYSLFSFIAPRKEKVYSSYWYNCTQHQFSVITDECIYWDGTTRGDRNSFSSRIKENADFIQFAYSSQNKRSVVSCYEREDGSIDYYTSLTKESKVSMLSRRVEEKIEIKEYKTLDGYQYCFEVESHMLILRRNGRIFVTGNTGKTTVTRVILNIYSKYGHDNFKLCALSGRASSVLGEASGYPELSSTIHRTLGINIMTGGWCHTYENKFTSGMDILLIDEISMVDYYLLYSILAPVNRGIKIIVLGDSGQLPSLNFGRPIETLKLFDIQFNELTQVMRQSEDAYILKVANDVRKGIVPFKNTKYTWMGADTEICIGDSYEYMINTFVEKFKDDKSTIVATTTKATTDKINFAIQEKLIKQGLLKKGRDYIQKPSSTKGKVYKMYIGDYIMVLKNNYHCTYCTDFMMEDFYEEDEEEVRSESASIFNGEIYKVKDIIDKYTILTDGYVDILVETSDLDCQLAYCSNVHKLQGSGFNNVFVYTTDSYVDRKMIISREWLYTAYTRSKKMLSIHTNKYYNLMEGIERRAIDEKVTLIEYYKNK